MSSTYLQMFFCSYSCTCLHLCVSNFGQLISIIFGWKMAFVSGHPCGLTSPQIQSVLFVQLSQSRLWILISFVKRKRIHLVTCSQVTVENFFLRYYIQTIFQYNLCQQSHVQGKATKFKLDVNKRHLLK